jgi:quercetin dioxygenase-like cupin family protein
MNRLLVSALACACLWSATALAEVQDAVAVDPDVHKLVLENDFVRVFDARASKGTTSPMHSHPPMVLISLDRTRFRLTAADGADTIFDLNPGQVIWVPGTQHAWDLLAGELHVIAVEIKSAQGAEAPPAVERPADDAVKVDPGAHQVLFENPHVRVFEARVSHPRKSPMHSHPPMVLVSLDWARLKLTLPDGNQVVHDFHPGQVLWFPEGLTHAWESIAGSGRVIAVEVKGARVTTQE